MPANNTYAWTISALDTYPTHESKTDVVHTIHWRLDGTDANNNSSGIYGSLPIKYDANTSYTAFSSLTKNAVESWVEAALGAEQIITLKTNIDNSINLIITPTTVSKSAPWLSANT